MNECLKYQDLISCLIDGELTENEKAELDAHIASCPSCKAYFEFMTLMSDCADIKEPPAELTVNVMKTIGASGVTAPKKKRRNIGRWIALAACLALIILTVPRISGRFDNSSDSTMSLGGGSDCVMYEGADDGAVAEDEGADDAEIGAGAGNGTTEATNGTVIDEESCDVPTSTPVDKSYGDETSLSEPSPSPSEAETSTPSSEEQDAVDSDSTTSARMSSIISTCDPEDTYGASYAAVAEIYGELPDLLAEYEKTDNGNGTYDIVIPDTLLEKLEALDITICVYEDSDSGDILVIYEP